MKRTIFGILALTLLAACSAPLQTTVYVEPQHPAPAPPPQPAPPAGESYQVFYDQLSAYGTWIDHPGYGYVWQPNVGPDFRPYVTNGHWVYSDAGWTWVSGYPWGWATFHYGRWFFEEGYGWLWVPGHQWAPAWVTWGHSGDYYGWAPIAPNVDVAAGNWSPPANTWNFVPAQHITKPDVVNYTVVHNNNTVINNIVKNVTVINNIKTVNNNTYVTNNNVTNNNVTNNHVVNNNIVYNRGPEVKEVENVTNVKIQKVNIQENNKPGETVVNNNSLVIYRPVIKPAAEQQKGNNKPKPQQIQAFHPKPVGQ
jgi:hypothetical protein